jgi:hypothetical protein
MPMPDERAASQQPSPMPVASVAEPAAPAPTAPSPTTDVSKRAAFEALVAAFTQRPLIVPGLIAALALFGALGTWH